MTPHEAIALPVEPRRVLIVDASRLRRAHLRARLRLEEVGWLEAEDAGTALQAAQACRPDLVVLNPDLPDLAGAELIRRLQADPRTHPIPVIVVSDADGAAFKAQSLELGAVDYVTRPFDPVEFRARIRVALRAKFVRDLLEERAHIDGLTGLGNRLALEERLEAEWAATRRRGAGLGLMVVDLDRFKRINDRLGHPAGDEVLRRAARVLRASARQGDFVGRFGGEEFVILAPDCDLEGVFLLAERFRERIAAEEILYGRERIRVTASVGVAAAPGHSAGEPRELLASADRALYRAKAEGRDAVRAEGVRPDELLAGPAAGGLSIWSIS